MPKVAQSYLAFLAQSYLAKLAHSILAVTVYHGIATKYLNKYCAMFSLMYKNNNLDEVIDFVFNLLSLNTDKYRIKSDEIRNHNILDLGQFVNLN